jgi:hypothetical protein
MQIIIMLNESQIYENILKIIEEHQLDPKGITKTELTRIYSQKHGTSKSVIWDYIRDLLEDNKIILKARTKKQQTLFIID